MLESKQSPLISYSWIHLLQRLDLTSRTDKELKSPRQRLLPSVGETRACLANHSHSHAINLLHAQEGPLPFLEQNLHSSSCVKQPDMIQLVLKCMSQEITQHQDCNISETSAGRLASSLAWASVSISSLASVPRTRCSSFSSWAISPAGPLRAEAFAPAVVSQTIPV